MALRFDREKFKRLRLERGFTQRALADAIGREFTLISAYENGRRGPSVAALASVATVLNAPMEAFVSDDEAA